MSEHFENVQSQVGANILAIPANRFKGQPAYTGAEEMKSMTSTIKDRSSW